MRRPRHSEQREMETEEKALNAIVRETGGDFFEEEAAETIAQEIPLSKVDNDARKDWFNENVRACSNLSQTAIELAKGDCIAVTDASHAPQKKGRGSAAWVIVNKKGAALLKGKTLEDSPDSITFRSEVLGMVMVLKSMHRALQAAGNLEAQKSTHAACDCDNVL